MAYPFPKIDIFCHILPERYRKALYQRCRHSLYTEGLENHHKAVPALYDMELRLGIMKRYERLRQVISVTSPPVEVVVGPRDAIELSQMANDEMAELVVKYPEHFAAAAACLPMNDMDAALREAQRAIDELKMKGILLYTPCNGKGLDSPEFMPLYEMMTRYDLPIWLHPTRGADTPEYKNETESKYRIFQTVGWPYETSVAMVRLVLSGVLEKYPSLKIITHHCGAMIPYFAGRMSGAGQKTLDAAAGIAMKLTKPTLDYFKMFYGDTALSGYTPALMLGYTFFGADHIVFGSDSPFGAIEEKIGSVEQMDIPDADKRQIFEGNARRLLRI